MRPRSVLFVCQGNLYRSPYAAAAFVAALPPPLQEQIRVGSAGFVTPGHPAPDSAVAAATRYGLDLQQHRSTYLTADRLRDSDWVVVMDVEQHRAITSRFGRIQGLIVLGDLDPLPIRTRSIVDPANQPVEVLTASYARVQRCVRELARAVRAGSGLER